MILSYNTNKVLVKDYFNLKGCFSCTYNIYIEDNMRIYKSLSTKDRVDIAKSFSQNNNLSLKSRGLMLFLYSQPINWKLNVDNLTKILKEGRQSILSSLSELKKAGYIYHIKLGFKEGWTYFVFEIPKTTEEFHFFIQKLPEQKEMEEK